MTAALDADLIRGRSEELFRRSLSRVQFDTDRVFFWLLLVQWALAIVLALAISPYAWEGKIRSIHLHVQLAVFGGAILNVLPLTLIALRPGAGSTRQVVAVTQMLWSALFVHLTGGRIETHFHIFGSLAFLSFYRDPRLLMTATLVVAADHLLLGSFWPESVYGTANPEWWRFLEHAGWVLFEDVVLYVGCLRALREKHALCEREAALEFGKLDVERQVADRTLELKTSGDRYRTLIENTSAVPWEIERDTCRVVYVAPQMHSLFGGAADPASQPDLLALFHPDDRAAFKEFVVGPRSGRDGEHRHIDTRIVRKDNQIMHVRSFVADGGDGNRSATVCGISLDITRQKKLEHELLQAQKLESIGQLSAGIAHEINTPTQFIGDNIRFLQETVAELLTMVRQIRALAVRESATPADPRDEIRAILDTVDLPYLQEEIPKAISQSLDGVERISKIVGAMNEFSHPVLERIPHDLNRAIESTVTVAKNEWKYVADVVLDLDPGLPPVPVMPGAFNQVILNMLINASHALADANAHDPSSKGTITVSTRAVESWAEIRIEDTGSGIPENVRDRIFDPFFTTKPVGKGTGQGLAIAHDVIVNKHHGTISVDSVVGSGTTFTLRVPLDQNGERAAVAA